MIYHLSLQAAGIIAGAVLVLIGLPGLLKPNLVQDLAKRFPRSRAAGITLLTVDLVWSFWLLATMEMGEFSSFRRPLLIALPIGYFLALRFVDEFLAVRALGIFCLLAAEPLLDAAFFRYEAARLILTVWRCRIFCAIKLNGAPAQIRAGVPSTVRPCSTVRRYLSSRSRFFDFL